MARKILGISWLNGRFHAAALSGGAVVASWSPPTAVEDADFPEALAEAVRQTRFSGNQVMMVIDHRSLQFHVQDSPPAEGKLVDQILERLVARNQFFEESAMWGRLTLPEAKGKHRHLLALLPGSLVHQLIAAAASLRLDLVGVFPLASVLGDQLRLLSAQEGETVLLAADLGGALHLLLGRSDGQVLFSRTVAVTGQQPAERAAQEINRTLHYAQQQFGAAVNKLFIYGAHAFALLQNFPIRAGLTVTPSPVAEDPLYFARNLFLVSPKLRLNLIPPSRQKKKKTQHLVAAAVAVLLIAGIGTAAVTEVRVRAREREGENQARRESAAEEIRRQASARDQEVGYLQATLAALGGTNDAPIAELFLRHLGAQTPPEIRLVRVDLSWATNAWNLRLEGFSNDSRNESIEQIERFERWLQTNAFRVRIRDSTRLQLTHGAGSAPTASAKRSAGRESERAFFIDGTIE